MKISKSLKAKMLVRFLVLIFVVIAINGAIGAVFSIISATSTLEKTMSETALVASVEVENRLGKTQALIAEFGMSSDMSSDKTAEEKMAFLANRANMYGLVDYNFTDTDGINSNGIDVSSNNWFTRAIAGEAFIDTPAMNGNGQFLMYISAPICDPANKSSISGVVYVALDASFLSDVANKIQIGELGHAFMIDHEGTFIAHYDYSKVTAQENDINEAKSNSAFAEKAALEQQALKLSEGQSMYGTYMNGASRTCVAMARISGTEDWVIGITADQNEFISQTIVTSLITTAVVALVCLIIAALFIVAYTNAIVNPITEISKAMKKLSVGDLKVSVKVTTKDEIGVLASEINETAKSLDNYVSEISRISGLMSNGNFDFREEINFEGDFVQIAKALDYLAEHLSDAMLTIKTAAEQVNIGATQISEGAQSLASGTTEQASSIDELASTINTLDERVSINARHASEASAKSKLAGDRISTSNKHMSEMITAMENISQKSSEINNIISTIDDIAFQTNILALNAAIEAARAGEAGRGFAVVAEQIGKLASSSSTAADDIAKLTTEIESTVETTVRQMQESVSEVQKNVEIVSDASETFDRLYEKVDETGNRVDSMIDLVGRLNEVAQEMQQITESQTRTAAQITASADEVNRYTENVAADSNTMAKSAEELRRESMELMDKMGKFKL